MSLNLYIWWCDDDVYLTGLVWILNFFIAEKMLKTPVRRSIVENNPLYYPFGITRFRNILENLSCGIGFDNGIKVIYYIMMHCVVPLMSYYFILTNFELTRSCFLDVATWETHFRQQPMEMQQNFSSISMTIIHQSWLETSSFWKSYQIGVLILRKRRI